MSAQTMTTKRAMSDMSSKRRRGVTAVLVAVVALLASTLPAAQAQAAPEFTGTFTTAPTTFRGGDMGDNVNLTLRNSGDTAVLATDPITVVVDVPEGVTLRGFTPASSGWTCTVATRTCTRAAAIAVNAATTPVNARLAFDRSVVGDVTVSFAVSGGGAPSATFDEAVAVEPFRPFGVHDLLAGAYDVDGELISQAGAHPDKAAASFEFNANTTIGGNLQPVEDVRKIVTDLPAGFIGNPQVVKECPESVMVAEQCPGESLIGRAIVRIGGQAVGEPTGVYSVVPGPGHAAEFGFAIVGIGVTFMYASVRTDGDYGITLTVPTTPAGPKIDSVSVEMFGDPADPKYDPIRCSRMNWCFGGSPSSNPRKPFLTMSASECTGVEPITRFTMDSWENKGTFFTFEAASPAITGCDRLTFEPAVDIAPTTTAPDAPTGLNVDMAFPHEDNAEGLAPPALKKAVVTLPEGMTINPAAAGGLEACADSQLNLKSKDPMTCPDAAKIGSVTAKSPVLKETLTGGVYIRSQNSDDPESGQMFRLALVLESTERGLSFRLPGEVRVNKNTGRIETTFDNNPELPVESIDLRLKEGPRAPLATPATCGEKTIDTTLTSWGKQTVTRQSTFLVSCADGLGAFSPEFVAGSKIPVAGGSSPFNVKIDRPDGQDVLAGVKVDLPTGLLAKVKGNLGTQVGEVDVAAGPGSQPFWLKGKVFLEGAYGDAPYSLRVVVPAKAGPFDLGDVIVRQKIYVDPFTAQVSVVSDPVPIVVKGVPVRLRTLNVSVDKPGFMVNPTSCAEKQVRSTLTGAGGLDAAVASRFQVGDCAALPFKPRLGLRLTGRKQVSTGKHPGVKAQVNQTGIGEAGIQKAVVRLPKSIALDPENAQALCEFEDGTKPDLEKHCPKGSIVGRARAKTPLLERDLVGNVYFVKNVRKDSKTGNTIRTLPMIVVALRGEIGINLKGESSTTKGGRLVNTFNNVPDAPITKFNLNIAGGKNGILAVTRTRKAKINVCASRQIAEADMDGQNGRQHDVNVRIKTPCTKRQTKAAKRKAKRAAAKARH
jgi:hypothetical protein